MTETTKPLPDSALRGLPKMVPCAWCGGSRADQVRLSFYSEDEKPLCQKCHESEYGARP